MRLKPISVLLSLFLTLLLTGCVKPLTIHDVVKQPNLPIPASLLIECQVPDIPTPFTYGDSVLLNLKLLDSLDDCNGKLRAIQQIEESRASQ